LTAFLFLFLSTWLIISLFVVLPSINARSVFVFDMQVDPSAQVHTFLASLSQRAVAERKQDLAQHFQTFENLYDRKLWHQLTFAIENFLASPHAGPYLIPLYENFVSDFEQRLNKLKLVAGLGILAARQTGDAQASIKFLDKLAEKCKPKPQKDGEPSTPDQTDIEAHVLCVIEAAHYHLLLGDFDKVLKSIKLCRSQLEPLTGVDPRVSATFYRVSADYYKAKSEYGDYYHTALLFLGCIPSLESDISIEERVQRAHDLVLAALLSETIYNFGELLLHPILDSLNGTPHEWLRHLFAAFKSGDISRFESLGGQFNKQPLLIQNLGFLRQKICLMTLMQVVFTRKAHDRVIRFDVLARETRLPLEEVEHLVMKALSLKLIKGTIDQVDQTIQVTWVQPRVMDKGEIKLMSGMVEEWLDRVSETTKKMEEQGNDLFVSA